MQSSALQRKKREESESRCFRRKRVSLQRPPSCGEVPRRETREKQHNYEEDISRPRNTPVAWAEGSVPVACLSTSYVPCFLQVLQRLEESRNAFLLFAAPSPSLQSSTLSAFEASCTKNGSDFLTERRPGHGDVWGSEDFFPVGARKTPSPVLSSGVVWRRLWKRTLDELLSSLPTTSADEASSPFPRSQECPGGKQRALSSSLVADSSLPTPACVTVEARRATQAEEEKKGVGPDTEKSQQLGQAWNVVMVAVREICRNCSKELLEEQIVRHLSFLWTRHGDASEGTRGTPLD